MSNPFPIVLADLRKNIVSSVGIFLLLAFACSIQFVANTFIRNAIDSVSNAADDFDLVVGAPGSKLDLVLASVFLRTEESLPLLQGPALEQLEHDSRVAALSPLVFADSYQGYPIVGIGKDFPLIRPSMHLSSGTWAARDYEAVVGANIGVAVGDSFESAHEGSPDDHHEHISYHVTGILARTGTPWDRAILVPYTSLWAIHGYSHADYGDDGSVVGEIVHGDDENPGVSVILVKPADFASAYALRSEYRTGSTVSAFPGEILANLFGLFSNVESAVTGLGWMIELLVCAAAILSLLASLPTKYRWIGLLRSLGAGRWYIFFTLWFQSAMIFILAGIGGICIGSLVTGWIVSMVSSGFGLQISLVATLQDFVSLGIFLVIGFIGALIPAFVGFRVSPRKVLLGQ